MAKGAIPSTEAAGSNSLDRGMFGSARSIFYIERGFPAEREIGERETNWSVVHNISTIGNRTRFVCTFPPFFKQGFFHPPMFSECANVCCTYFSALIFLYTFLHSYLVCTKNLIGANVLRLLG
jgi:hypothetical protein